MKAILLIAALAVSSSAYAQTHTVRGYLRSDGTYVAPHVQTNPNSTKLDNLSSKPNYNPYTGKNGTVDPYKPTQSNPFGSPYNQPRSSSDNE